MDTKTGELTTIGRVAKTAGVGVETVRFYEREGLLETPVRTAAGYRLFDEDAVDRLRFIARAKRLGFTLGEIRELLHFQVDDEDNCEDVRAAAESKLAEIEEKIRTLKRMRKILLKLTDACRTRDPTGACPILETLRDEHPGQPKPKKK